MKLMIQIIFILLFYSCTAPSKIIGETTSCLPKGEFNVKHSLSFNPHITPAGIKNIDTINQTGERVYTHVTIPLAINYTFKCNYGLNKKWQLGVNGDFSFWSYSLGINNKISIYENENLLNISLYNRSFFAQGITLSGTSAIGPVREKHLQSNLYLIFGLKMKKNREFMIIPFYGIGQIFSLEKESYSDFNKENKLFSSTGENHIFIINPKLHLQEAGVIFGFENKKNVVYELGMSGYFNLNQDIQYLGYKYPFSIFLGASFSIN